MEQKKKGKIYLVKEKWWNHLDSNPHSFYCIKKIVSFIIPGNCLFYVSVINIFCTALYNLVNF